MSFSSVIRRIFYWLTAGLFLWFLIKYKGEFLSVFAQMSDGKWYWMIGALFLQLSEYMFHNMAMVEAYRSLGVDRDKGELFRLNVAVVAVNVLIPTLNVAGVAFLVDEARRRGYPGRIALVANLLTVFSDGLVFLTFASAMGFIFISTEELNPFFLFVPFLLLIIVGLAFLAGVYFWHHPHRLRTLMHRFLRWWPGEKKVEHWATQWVTLTEESQISISHLAKIMLSKLTAHFVAFLCLSCVFRAFGIVGGFPLLPATAYAAAIFFMIFSPTPMGIGVVEGAMILAMVNQGVSTPTATAIAISYRGLAFWLPFLVGFFFLQQTRKGVREDVRHLFE